MEIVDVLRRLYPEYGADGRFRTAADFTRAVGSAGEALLYAELYCPPLVEVDDMVFLRWTVGTERDVADVRSYEEEGWGRRDVERLYNHLGLCWQFGNARPYIADEEERLLGEILAEAWRAWLGRRYPARRFAVEMIGPEGDAERIVPHEDCLTLTFSQDR
jgi:hypothetical protein